MPVKSDKWIIEMAQRHQMISPFEETQVRTGISFGVSSYGYDFRLSQEFQILDTSAAVEVDPKKHDSSLFRPVQAASIVVSPNSFVLARSLEYFRIPRNIITLCTGKSTYARSGIIVNVTPFEPEWEGFATLSLINGSPLPVRIYADEGIGQLIFLESDEVCAVSYKDKKGKYQGQRKITLSKLD